MSGSRPLVPDNQTFTSDSCTSASGHLRTLGLVSEGRFCPTRYWITAAMARSTLSRGQKVTGPGAAPGVAILVP